MNAFAISDISSETDCYPTLMFERVRDGIGLGRHLSDIRAVRQREMQLFWEQLHCDGMHLKLLELELRR
jgi:hypothetical protein